MKREMKMKKIEDMIPKSEVRKMMSALFDDFISSIEMEHGSPETTRRILGSMDTSLFPELVNYPLIVHGKYEDYEDKYDLEEFED